MIATFFLSIFNSLIGGLLGLLPVGHLSGEIGAAISYFVSVANAFSYVVPVATLLQAVALILIVDGAILAWHFINWVIRKIPGMQ